MPIFDLNPLKYGEILGVGGNQDEAIHLGDGRDLAIGKWGRLTQANQSGSFSGVPLRRLGIVGQYWNREGNNIIEVLLNS